MKTILTVAILWLIMMVVAYTAIAVFLLVKKEEGTVSPLKLYRLYRRQLCFNLKNKSHERSM